MKTLKGKLNTKENLTLNENNEGTKKNEIEG
jgi:hypothetical protein